MFTFILILTKLLSPSQTVHDPWLFSAPSKNQTSLHHKITLKPFSAHSWLEVRFLGVTPVLPILLSFVACWFNGGEGGVKGER
jgi:hypothetical protein